MTISHINVSPDINKPTADAIAEMAALVAYPIISEHYGLKQSEISAAGDSIMDNAKKDSHKNMLK